MKIAILGSTKSTHVQKWVYSFLKKPGSSVTIISAGNVSIKGVTQICKVPHNIRPMPFRYIFLFLFLLFSRSLKKYDVVHAHYATYYGFMASFLAPNKTITFGYGSDLKGLMSCYRDELPFENKYILFQLTSYAIKNSIIFCTIGDFYLKKVKQIRKDLATISIFFGVTKTIFYPREKYEKFTIFSNRAHYPVYDISTIIQALSLLPDYQFICLISGEGPESSNIEKLVKKYRLESKIHFLGRIKSHRNLAKVLAKSHVYVSAAKSEGMPVSILEAFFSKTAVISTNIPELNEFIQKNIILASFLPGNHHELVERIKWAILNPEALKKTQDLAFKYALQEADWHDTVLKINLLNDTIIKSKHFER